MKVALNAFLIYANHHVGQNAAGLISWCEIKDVTYREDAVASSAAGKVLARPGASDAAVSALTGTGSFSLDRNRHFADFGDLCSRCRTAMVSADGAVLVAGNALPDNTILIAEVGSAVCSKALPASAGKALL